MDLTFQVPIQYWSLQHQTLLLSPVTSTAGYSFCLGSIPSFFLELFLHGSPVAYWAPTDLGSFSFSILSCCCRRLQLVHQARVAAASAPSAAERSHPTSEVRGRSREDPMPEGRRPRGVTPHPRSGAEAESTRLRRGRNGQEELPCI